jgi:hypothetical protein
VRSWTHGAVLELVQEGRRSCQAVSDGKGIFGMKAVGMFGVVAGAAVFKTLKPRREKEDRVEQHDVDEIVKRLAGVNVGVQNFDPGLDEKEKGYLICT